MRTDLPTGTVTFLFTDIEGSTELVERVAPVTYRAVLERHHAIMRSACAAHDGVERGTQGDAFLVVFRDAPSAVAAAVEAQQALAAEPWPPDAVVRYIELAPYDTEVIEVCLAALGHRPHPAVPLLKGRLAVARG